MKSRINAIAREVGRLLNANTDPARSPDGDRWWRAWWKLEAILDAMERRIDALAPEQTDLPNPVFVVVSVEARRLGIETSPEVATALKKLRRAGHMAHTAREFVKTWDQRRVFAAEIEKAGSAALALILDAWGVKWPGYFPQCPPREPPPPVPAWVSDLTDAELLGFACGLTDVELQEWADELRATTEPKGVEP